MVYDDESESGDCVEKQPAWLFVLIYSKVSAENQHFIPFGVRQLAADFVTQFDIAAKAQASLRTPKASPPKCL